MLKPSILLLPILGLVYSATLNVYIGRPGHQISPRLWGLFIEEINHALDGGLYGELIKNRVLNVQGGSNLEGYSAFTSGPAQGSISLSLNNPLNDVLTTSLRLDSVGVAESGRVGISNSGFWGIPIRPDYTTYKASFYAKSPTYRGPLTVSIESANGSIIYASSIVPGITDEFQKYEVVLEPESSLIQNPSMDNIFVISAPGPITSSISIFFNVVSLFPPTWKDRENGMRIDLAQKLADSKPSFLRFPGGSFIEGYEEDGKLRRFVWEETIGDVSMRPGHPGFWGYYVTNGVGLLEYLQFAEDLGAEIILVVYCGYTKGYEVPVDDLGPYVQSALNEIEYAIGDTSTEWGALRASHGHPAPFNVTFVEIGNEDWFTDSYAERYPPFYDAITEKYPDLVVIANDQVPTRPMPVRDDHYYPRLGGFPSMHDRYDNENRTGSKIFVGEYATRDGDFGELTPAHTLSALEDAVFMTGMERNSDIVIMACYAPLFANVNDFTWTPDAIYYDGLTSFATPAWWVQHLFSVKRGDTYIPTEGADNLSPNIYHVASRNTETNTIILKIVNVGETDVTIDTLDLTLIGTTKGGMLTVLKGGARDENSLQNPLNVAPTVEVFNVTTTLFSYVAPATSLTIFEIEL